MKRSLLHQYCPAVSSGNTLSTADQLKDTCWFVKGNVVKVERLLHKVEAQGGESQTFLILCGLLIREYSVC